MLVNGGGPHCIQVIFAIIKCKTVGKYIGVSKSSGNDILVPHIKLDKSFFLHRMIEKKMLFLSMQFDHTSTNIILIEFH